MTEVQNKLSRRAYAEKLWASSWEEIWEAGPYYQRISELLEDATEFAIFAGWQIDSRLPMPRPERPSLDNAGVSGSETLRQKVLRLCEQKPNLQLYFLMWDHAYFFTVERETWQTRIWEHVHPRVHFHFDNRHPFGGSHHEKVVVIDGKVALVGGIDLCDERWDSPQHFFYDPRRSLTLKRDSHGPYHDLAVQVTGPICDHIQNHVRRRWQRLSSAPFPEPRDPSYREKATGKGHQVYLSRTLSRVDAGVRGAPITREIEFLYRDLIELAQERLILEGQYYWSEEINNRLIAKMHERKGKPFQVILILARIQEIPSLTRMMSRFQLNLLEKLEKAATETGTQLLMGCPYVVPPLGEKAKAVYIHSKVIIADDRYLTIGSANLAARALRLDTEMNLTLEATTDADRAHIRHFSETLLKHWSISRQSTEIEFRPIQPAVELGELKKKSSLSWNFPFFFFFDPVLPWTYPLKRKFRVLVKREFSVILSVIVLILVAGGVLTLSLSDAGREPASWAPLYAILLSSVWLLPVPYVFTTIWATLHLGLDPAVRIMIASLWVASFIGYVLARMFPTPAAGFYRDTGPKWLPARIGLRYFPTLVSVLVDPRVSIRSKIAFQGLYTVPFIWFIFSTWIILPTAIYGLCRVVALLNFEPVTALAQKYGPFYLLGASIVSVTPVLVRLWKRKT